MSARREEIMKKLLLLILCLVLFFPIALRASNAYFYDSETSLVNMSADTDSPFFYIELTSGGNRYSSGTNKTFAVDLGTWKKRSDHQFVVGTVGNNSSTSVSIAFEVDDAYEDFLSFKPINNLNSPADIRLQLKKNTNLPSGRHEFPVRIIVDNLYSHIFMFSISIVD